MRPAALRLRVVHEGVMYVTGWWCGWLLDVLARATLRDKRGWRVDVVSIYSFGADGVDVRVERTEVDVGNLKFGIL